MDNRVGLSLLYAQVRDLIWNKAQMNICKRKRWKPAWFWVYVCVKMNVCSLPDQTVSDIERGWILVNKDQHRQLKSLQEKNSKKEVSRGVSLHFLGRTWNNFWGTWCSLLFRFSCLILRADAPFLFNKMLSFVTVHPSWPDSEILRLYQVWPLHHRLPREGLPGDRQRRQQRAQLPRQVAQRADEGGELQGHPHEVLASHVFCKCAKQRAQMSEFTFKHALK